MPYKMQVRGVTAAQVSEAVRRANAAVGGDVVQKGRAEYRGPRRRLARRRPGQPDAAFDSQRVIRDLENVTIPGADGLPVALSEIANISLGSQPRRGLLEKDGSEATGGVILMRHGENPVAVTRRIREKIIELQPGLPQGVRIVPFYDRTPLIRDTISTVTDTLIEAIVTASICIVIILRHLRSALIIALTLPLAVLMSFGLMDCAARIGHRRHSNELDVDRGPGNFDRRTGRRGDRHDGKRHAPPAQALWRRAGSRRRPQHGARCLPRGWPADLLFRRYHAAVVSAGLRARRARRQDVPSAGVHEIVRHVRGRLARHHAGAGAVHGASSADGCAARSR